MESTTISKSIQPQHDEVEGQPANAIGPSTAKKLGATISSVKEGNSDQPEGHASSKPNLHNDISSDSEPAPPLKFKSGKTLKTWKKGQAHDASYKPSKESDESDDTDFSQDWDESPLDKPTWKTPKKKDLKGHKHSYKLTSQDDDDDSQVAPQSKPHKPAAEIPAPEGPAAEAENADLPQGHKSPMPSIQGFNNIFQTAPKAGPPATPQPSNGNKPKAFRPGIFKGPPKAPQPPNMNREEAINDSNSDDDRIPWMTGRNRKRKMPDIPGFSDIFSIDEPASKTVKPYSYYKTPKPKVPKPQSHTKPSDTGIPNKIPKPNEPQFPAPQLPDLQLPDAIELEPALLKDRDWPPYPGTIYCKRCFYHDCFRAIKLRRHMLRILGLLECSETFLHFLREVLCNTAVKSPHLQQAFGKNYFYQQIPGDVTALVLLYQVVRHVEGKAHTAPSTETQAKMRSSLQEIRILLNLSDAQMHGITMEWFNSRREMERKLQEAGYSLPKVKLDDVRAILGDIGEALDPLLSHDLRGPTDPDEDLTQWQRYMEANISTALKVIDHKNSYAKPNAFIFKVPEPPKLNCSYCVHSGAENKAKANRPYPRALAADARIPWAESLHSRYPGQYDKNGNAIPQPFVLTGPFATEPITNAQKFLDKLRAEGAQETGQGGIKFLVCKGLGDGSSDGSSDVRFVLVKMWSLVEAIESLDFVPVEHAVLKETAE